MDIDQIIKDTMSPYRIKITTTEATKGYNGDKTTTLQRYN